MKWALAYLAIVGIPVGGTAFAAYFAGFNLAIKAASFFALGSWFSSAFMTLGSLNHVVASAAMVAGGLLSTAVVIGLIAVLVDAVFKATATLVQLIQSQASLRAHTRGKSEASTASVAMETHRSLE